MSLEYTVDHSRRKFLTTTTSVVGAVGVGYLMVPFFSYWQPSAKAQAAGAPVEIDISKLEPGQKMDVEWRGKPVWIVRRSKETLAKLDTLTNELNDPNSDELTQQPVYTKNTHRSINPEYLVLITLCTHLGCVPVYRPEVTADWPGGLFCPCHGSKFDLAGRVYKSVPAQLNLSVPPHSYISDTLLMIGVDQQQAQGEV